MSISVDDLVASLSSNHIGQEAMDLAALQVRFASSALVRQAHAFPLLQAQLSQTLFCPTLSSSPSTNGARRGTHVNTPVSRTPTTTSFCWERPDFDRRRSNSVASMSSRKEVDDRDFEHVDAMDEDERMVEDLLFPAPPSSNATPSQYPSAPPASPTTQYTMRSRQASVSTTYPPSAYDLSPVNTSMFATTDPFYLAQLQAAQTPSLFSQFGKPSQQSPFIKGHSFQGHSFAQLAAGTPC